MARKLEAAARRLEAAQAERDELLAEARAEGMTLREIARAAGVSHQTVVNLLAARQRRRGR